MAEPAGDAEICWGRRAHHPDSPTLNIHTDPAYLDLLRFACSCLSSPNINASEGKLLHYPPNGKLLACWEAAEPGTCLFLTSFPFHLLTNKIKKRLFY